MKRNYLLIFLLFITLPNSAIAATTDDARRFVDDVGAKVLGVVNTGGNEAQRKQQLQNMFSQYVDVAWMARFVLGHYWQEASPAQRERYLQAYQKYLLTRYTNNFADYNGSKYVITDVHDDGDGEFTVNMKINTPQVQDTIAGYRLAAGQTGDFKIHDIIIEGVSLITTERSEFASVAQRDGLDGLITAIINKTQAQ